MLTERAYLGAYFMPYTDMELGQYNLYLLRRLHLCQGCPAGLSRRSVALMLKTGGIPHR